VYNLGMLADMSVANKANCQRVAFLGQEVLTILDAAGEGGGCQCMGVQQCAWCRRGQAQSGLTHPSPPGNNLTTPHTGRRGARLRDIGVEAMTACFEDICNMVDAFAQPGVCGCVGGWVEGT
jgi:hypothetical protein